MRAIQDKIATRMARSTCRHFQSRSGYRSKANGPVLLAVAALFVVSLLQLYRSASCFNVLRPCSMKRGISTRSPLRGTGAGQTLPSSDLPDDSDFTSGQNVQRSVLVQLWGVLGVAAYLSYGVKKVIPIVREGVGAMTSPWHWVLLAATLGFFAYVEGYKGFQLGFAPRVVSRAWALSTLPDGKSTGDKLWHKVLAPAFCIGYFHGTRKRVVSSWLVTSIIFCVVVAVKRLANPYRAILDAGVIVGLLWGSAAVVTLYAQSRSRGRPPDFDPCLPKDTPYRT